jgi:hypothetical protein
MIYFYRYAHVFIFPSSRQHILKGFSPTKNAAETLLIFSRILGLALIFSDFYFNMSQGILYALFNFLIMSVLIFFSYLSSLYLIESIILYNFEYLDEIQKRKNFSYAIVNSANALAVAYVLKMIVHDFQGSLILFLFMWLLGIIFLGIACKLYTFISKMPFNRLVFQRQVSVALSYLGYLLAVSLIIGSAFNTPYKEMKWYLIDIVMKVLMGLLIYPLFLWGLTLALQITGVKGLFENFASNEIYYEPELAYGIYEGLLFITCGLLTMLITGQVNFGTFYPVL